MTTRYVAGFAFYGDLVALIEKRRGPKIVIGKLNAIGGHYESNDYDTHFAMQREFLEETGVNTDPYRWYRFCQLRVEAYDAVVDFFSIDILQQVKLEQKTDEYVAWYTITGLDKLNVVPNLRWLIPLAKADQRLFAAVTDTSR